VRTRSSTLRAMIAALCAWRDSTLSTGPEDHHLELRLRLVEFDDELLELARYPNVVVNVSSVPCFSNEHYPFLDTHPDSKSRPRAIELLISTHAALGDKQLQNGDTIGGIEQLMHAIDEADVTISDKLFSGVIAQIPTNLYLRGEREAAFKAAQNVEAKFGNDPKRLLAMAGFYLSVERAADTVRAPVIRTRPGTTGSPAS